MDRIRIILFESSIIFLTGASVALCVVGVLNYLHRPTLENFSREYKPGTLEEQVVVADKYLQWFTPRELNLAIEQQNTDIVCHGQAHALGRAVYKKYPNLGEVARQCEGLCSYGCVHGAIMQMFSTDSDTLGGMIEEDTLQGYVEHIQRISDSLCKAPEVASVVKPRYCYHGLGHVFGFLYGADPKRAIASCDYFTNPHAAQSCRNGVLMEYMLAKPQKALLYTKDDALCDSFPQYTSLCYRFKAYGWLYVWRGPKPALKGF